MIDPGLNGKHVLITGANNPHGIGAATAKAFARLSCSVFLHYFREPARPTEPGDTPGEAFYQEVKSRTAQGVVDEINRAGGKAYSWEADLAIQSSARELLDQAEACFGPVHVLINNAAHCSYDTFVPQGGPVYGEGSAEYAGPLTPESHDMHFAVNSRATALLMAEFARRHVGRNATWGRIVNISTDASSAHPGAISYGASKHALESYSRAAAWELARYGITVNIIAPDPIQTGWISPTLEAQVVPRIPPGRIGSPNDIADGGVVMTGFEERDHLELARLIKGLYVESIYRVFVPPPRGCSFIWWSPIGVNYIDHPLPGHSRFRQLKSDHMASTHPAILITARIARSRSNSE